MRLHAIAIVLTVALCAVAAAAQESAAAEQELLRMLNQARSNAGVPALEWNEWLAQAAREHAEQMAKHGQLSHQFPDEPSLRERLTATGLRFNASAENVALAPAAAEMHNDWLQSPPHRRNMLNPLYNAVAVGVVRKGEELYAVTDFAHTVPAQSAAELEDAVAAAVNHLRAQQKKPPLARHNDPKLRAYACQLAKQDRLEVSPLLSPGKMISALAFTDSDPADFGSHIRSDLRGFHAFSVGACFARNEKYPEGTNWVVVGFY